MILNIVLLIVGFVLLIRGANAFVDGAAALAHRFNIPEIVIGLTVVAMGTSAPEAAVSISSALQGASAMAVGNVLGSNIVNILLILGMSAVISPLNFKKKTIQYEIPFIIFITIIMMWFGVRYGIIDRFAAAVLLMLFVGFMVYMYSTARKEIINAEKEVASDMSIAKIIVFLCLGLAALVFGSDLTVKSATNLATLLHVPNRIIGLTLVAAGTSLPELVTCIAAARKKRTGLIVGNIIGSNIFNVLFVLGLTGLVMPVPFEYAFVVDAAISIVITVLLWLFAIYEQNLTRSEGAIFLVCYVLYLMYLI
jgi:cation:H+ antiporter